MDDDFVKDFIKLMGGFWVILVMLMVVSFIVGCDSGWTIAGWEVK
jgi:hypothetical protein